MTQAISFGMPRKGDFQHFMLCGAFEPRLDDLLDQRGYHGVVPEGLYPWGTLRGASGNLYTIARRVPFGPPVSVAEKGEERKALGRRLMINSNKDAEGLVLNLDHLRAAGVSDDPIVERAGDHAVLRNGADPRGKSWRIEVNERRMLWNEQDSFSLQGTLIWPGLQWYLIARDESTFYASLMFQATGTVLGEPVQGFIFLEQAYMAEGGMLYAHRDTLVAKGVETTWYTFATRYEDGSVEAGHFIAGHDRSGFFMLTDGQQVLHRSSNLKATVIRNADGHWHDRIDLDVDGERWEMISDPRGRLLSTAKMPNPQQEGLVRRVGETRKPLAWCAWGESAPGHGNVGRNRYSV
jgi:hypothetical protein